MISFNDFSEFSAGCKTNCNTLPGKLPVSMTKNLTDPGVWLLRRSKVQQLKVVTSSYRELKIIDSVAL